MGGEIKGRDIAKEARQTKRHTSKQADRQIVSDLRCGRMCGTCIDYATALQILTSVKICSAPSEFAIHQRNNVAIVLKHASSR